MPAFDLIIRGGNVVDGSGDPARTADVGVVNGRITEVGRVQGGAHRVIDADGALVAPGWVDIHTHYDGQITWDERLAPSSWHGVTTAVMGNCGVGFAPVHTGDHQTLIEIMEGVEDIPGTALHEGLTWTWETFPDYLDHIDRPHDIDFATYVPHNPLRLFVMGERGARRELATDKDIAEMGRLARQGLQAGALGFSTDRFGPHRTKRGEHTPAYGAAADECVGIAQTLRGVGQAVLHLVSDFDPLEDEYQMVEEMTRAAGLPTSFTLLYSYDDVDQRRVRRLLGLLEASAESGLEIRGQVACRGIGLLYGLQCTLNPFSTNPVYRAIEDLSLDERYRRMREPEFKRALFENVTDAHDSRIGGHRLASWDLMYKLADPPNYEPDPSESFSAIASRRGCAPYEIAYEVMLEDGGRGMIYVPTVNYRDGNLNMVKEMLEHPLTLPGLSDGGAHVGSICDASFPTTLLEYWGRDRTAGLSIPDIIKQQCRDTAHFVGLKDRGVIAPGYRADLNLIDLSRLAARRPEIHDDLPAGGRRLMQRADGYLHTVVNGVGVYEDGVATGALPGRLVRGAQAGPAT